MGRLVYFARLALAFLFLRADLVHVLAGEGDGLAVFAAIFFPGPPVVVSVPDLRHRPAGFFARLRRRIFYRLLARRGAKVRFLARHKGDAEILSALAPSRVPAVVVRRPAVDAERFRPSQLERVLLDENPMKVHFGLKLRRDSGLEDLRQAALILRAKKVRVDVMVSGAPRDDDPEFYSLRELKAWQAEGWMRLVGAVDAIDGLLRSADVVIAPSRRPGLSRFLVEAAASGKAIVATDQPGTRELILPGKNGLLYPAGDTSALARALEKLALDEDLRSALGLAARYVAESMFAESIAAGKTREVYDSLSQA